MQRRPLDVIFIAVYCAGFSAVLLVILTWQVLSGHVHGSWADKAVVLPFSVLVALLPGVLAFGLWLLDNAARIAVILFALLHAISEIAFLGNAHIPSRTFPLFRIALDVVIVLCLCRPEVRKVFQWQSIKFSLPNSRTHSWL